MAKKQSKRFVLSDESVKNSYGFFVLTAGIRLDRFNSNPVMLDTHNNTNTAVLGKWDDIKKEGATLTALPVFDTDDDQANLIAGKVERGYINGASVGLLFEPENLVQKGGKIFLVESELIEASICPVPSNPNALQFFVRGKEDTPLSKTDLQKLCLSVKKTKQIKLINNKSMELNEQLIGILGLDDNADDTVIVAAVQKLVDASDEVDNQQLKANTDKVKLAITQGKIKATQSTAMLAFAKQNPIEFNNFIDQLPAKQSLAANIVSPTGTLGGVNHTLLSQDNFDKPKSQWTLDDYRKYAPNELAANPELYNNLITLKYKK